MNNRKENSMDTLKQMREQKELTLLDVALKLGYKYPSSYAKIEKGEQQLKSTQIMLLADLFCVSKEKILQTSYSK